MNGWRTGIQLRPFDHLGLKAVSLGLAVGLWGLVPDPSLPHIVTGVPVRLENIPTELTLSTPFNTLLEVTVSGPGAFTRNLTPGQLSPRVDMFGAFAGENSIALGPDAIDAPFGVTIQSLEPAQLRIALEERVRAEMPINAVVEGSPAEGYEITDKIVDPAFVTVTGPRSRVEAMTGVSTEVVNVAGRQESVMRQIGLITDDPLVRLEGNTRSNLQILIKEAAVPRQLEGMVVRIINATYRVEINPAEVGVVLRGPPSVLDALTDESITIVLDVEGLEPRAEDYRVEPRVVFSPAILALDLEILAFTPQRRIDVHVYPQPSR